MLQRQAIKYQQDDQRLQEALQTLPLKDPIKVVGASRTDAGVNALGQVNLSSFRK